MTTENGKAVSSGVPRVSRTVERAPKSEAGAIQKLSALLRGGAGTPPLFACAVLGLLACEEPAANAPVCGSAFGALGYKDGEAGLPKRDLQAAAAACSAAGLPAPDIALYETRYRAGHYVARAGRGFAAAPRVSVAAPTPAPSAAAQTPVAAAPAQPPAAAPTAAPMPSGAPGAPANAGLARPAAPAPQPEANPLADQIQRALDGQKPAPAAAPRTAIIEKPAAPAAVPNQAPQPVIEQPAIAARPASPAVTPAPSAPIVAAPAAPNPVDRATASEPPRAPSNSENALIQASKPARETLSAPQAPAPTAQGPCGGKPCPEAVAATPPAPAPSQGAKQVFQSDRDLSKVPDTVLKPSLSAAERRLLGLQ